MHGWALAASLLAATVGMRPAVAAQAPADTAGLVTAVAGLIGDSILPRLSSRNRAFLGEPTTSFDATVSLQLEQTRGLTLLPARPDTAEWVVTRGYSIAGDTASIMIEVGTTTRPREGIDTYIETNRYVLVRTPTGWRFVRREFVGGADLGAVRG
jgi:hypothetical protein